MFRSCHLALFLWIISISQSKYSKNKYISLLEETRIKNFCRKKYRESRVVLLKVQDAKKKYNGKLRGYF